MTHYQSDFCLLHGSFGSIRGNSLCVVSVLGAQSDMAPWRLAIICQSRASSDFHNQTSYVMKSLKIDEFSSYSQSQ